MGDELFVLDETKAGKLTPQQEAAARMVLEGKSDTEISQELKVRRQTINEWRHHHVEFMLELKLRREQAWEKQQEKLSQAVEKALDVLMPLLEHEDEVVQSLAALAVLKMPATQANLKVKETMDVISHLKESEQTTTRVAQQEILEGEGTKEK